jgi:hypothetical protein
VVEKTVWRLYNLNKVLRNSKIVYELKQIGDKWGEPCPIKDLTLHPQIYIQFPAKKGSNDHTMS